MVDLKELEKEIDALLETETPETLKKWLLEYRNENLETYMGLGSYFRSPLKLETCTIQPTKPQNIFDSTNDDSCDHKYANAA